MLFVELSTCIIGALFKKSSPVPMCSRLFSTFSSIRFSVPGFMLRSPSHLDFRFHAWRLVWLYLHSSTCTPVQPASFVEDAFFFPVCISDFFLSTPCVHRCVILCLGLQFDSIDQCVYFSTNIMQFLLLQ